MYHFLLLDARCIFTLLFGISGEAFLADACEEWVVQDLDELYDPDDEQGCRDVGGLTAGVPEYQCLRSSR